jgi:DNA-binding NtrC family response regulator
MNSLDSPAHSLSTAIAPIGQRRDRHIYFWALTTRNEFDLSPLKNIGFDITPLHGVVEANEVLHSQDSCVVVVQFAPTTGGKELDQLEQLIAEHRQSAWVALVPAEWQTQERLCGLITRTFYDYHHLPPQWERLGITLGHALGMLELHKHVEELSAEGTEPGQLLGHSPAIEQVKKQLARVASYPGTVLIHGESGTGKELAARAIHRLSPRHSGPFEAVNCAALPSNLIQAELFGHEKGAYTDAHRQRPGRFELAHGGTLFLDEIGDMPQDQQVNLLRVLEQGCLRRIGGNLDVPVDVRVVSATHIDLEQAVAEGRFREDLYYRLNVLRLRMPPLRERDGDIELLARYVFQHLRQPGQAGPKGFSHEAIEAMSQHEWPGNVRELINRVQHAIVMAEGPLILPHDLGIERRETHRQRITLEGARNAAEIQAINDALYLHHHNVTEAARELDVSRVTLYRLMEKHGIVPH